ncbi:hypothetical protein I302_107266 [Kwoniella bestiolae CBS 10118]|uniref:Uncharacterized protein n=1 Tax=Kwoniella bestiolae CBS 10118 TaxID=1296100 RepID=A0A1B9FZ13_9TREE|nr:hypothetical protein I302_06998 [Kwoniella bestiolae CBS 10118]OCF24012.1 hypothetical protein I302_06998 [Kwoniella bestiolae CBS 10118]
MIASPIFAVLVASMGLIPSTSAVNGTVRLIFPENTYSRIDIKSMYNIQNGGVREIPFTEAGSAGAVGFFWAGPVYGNSSDRHCNSDSITTNEETVSSTSTAASSQETDKCKGLPHSWTRLCALDVDEQFNHDVEFTFLLQEDGLKGPKNSHVRIECANTGCHLPNGESCEGKYIMPRINTTELNS